MTQATFPPLTFTNNKLADIINLVKEKNIVALHTTTACRVFHNISFEQPELDSLKDRRVIYIDCNGHPGLLAQGEWKEIEIAIKGVTELGADSKLRAAIIDQRSIPNRTYVRLGYTQSKL